MGGHRLQGDHAVLGHIGGEVKIQPEAAGASLADIHLDLEAFQRHHSRPFGDSGALGVIGGKTHRVAGIAQPGEIIVMGERKAVGHGVL